MTQPASMTQWLAREESRIGRGGARAGIGHRAPERIKARRSRGSHARMTATPEIAALACDAQETAFSWACAFLIKAAALHNPTNEPTNEPGRESASRERSTWQFDPLTSGARVPCSLWGRS